VRSLHYHCRPGSTRGRVAGRRCRQWCAAGARLQGSRGRSAGRTPGLARSPPANPGVSKLPLALLVAGAETCLAIRSTEQEV
jgi:hypothetical protein